MSDTRNDYERRRDRQVWLIVGAWLIAIAIGLYLGW